MNPARNSLHWMVWGGLAVTIIAIVAAFIFQERQPQQRNLGSTDGSDKALPVLFEVPDFALTNQTGQRITRSDLRGQVWLADIIFTRCAGPCPEMTRRMGELQAAIPAGQPLKFVTLTTDPENDTPPVLQAYARRYLAQPGRWHFLTGTRQQIADLAVRGLKFSALEKEAAAQENPNDLFIHSTLFLLIDKQGRARAVFESDDALLKSRLLPAIDKLLRER
jgi:protein SCO1/2